MTAAPAGTLRHLRERLHRTYLGLVSVGDAIKDLIKTYVQFPQRKQQSESYGGPITLQQFERFQFVCDALSKKGINLPLPTGN